LGNTCDIPLSQLPTPCIKGDIVVVQVEEADYLAGIEDCKTHLHGQIILSKGDKPLTHLDLTKKLQPVWKALGPWKPIPLGKGFYEFEVSSLEDMRWPLGWVHCSYLLVYCYCLSDKRLCSSYYEKY